MENAAAFITFANTVVEAGLGWCGNVIEFMIQHAIIIVPLLVFFLAGGAVALVNRLIRG